MIKMRFSCFTALFLLLFLLSFESAKSADAENILTGHVTLEIVNKAPEIKGLFVSQNIIGNKTEFECNVNVVDENVKNVNYKYTWFKNGRRTKKRSATFSDFEMNDLLFCEVEVIDEHGSLDKDRSEVFEVQDLSYVPDSNKKNSNLRRIYKTTGFVVNSVATRTLDSAKDKSIRNSFLSSLLMVLVLGNIIAIVASFVKRTRRV